MQLAKPGSIAGFPAKDGPARPPEQLLAMPRAPLHMKRVPLRKRVRGRFTRMAAVIAARVFIGLFTVALTAYGVNEMLGVISPDDITTLQYIFLGLFAVNFAWISFALAQAVLGFFRMLAYSLFPPRDPKAELTIDTALLVPVYNEEPARVTAAVAAMAKELAEDAPGRFAFFILSDTNRPDAWLEEEHQVADLVAKAPAECPVYYRHRADNRERKAGNIANWVQRWGAAYEGMIVLDADSIMDAATLKSLALRLQENPDLGLIQTLPRIVRAKSAYARLQQFANRCFGPIYGNGLAFWHGRSSNFWGHNAIIRTRAFAEAARLPELKGEPPFGGHILSHDFAEAAFLRRAGWGVRLDTDLEGSYEEAPPTLVDVMIRDRRWCQGNLQHLRLVFARGFSIWSRMHFLTGVMAYMSAVFWFCLVIAGLFLAVQAEAIKPEYFAEPSLFPRWPVFDSERAIELFILSMGVVLGPKLLGWAAIMLNPRELFRYGGPLQVTGSLVWEVLFSALYAPVMMMAQTRIVAGILLGRDAGWQPQRRDDGGVPFGEIVRTHIWHTFDGAMLAVVALLINLDLFLWLLPVTAGLMLSIPLSAMSGSRVLMYLPRMLRPGRTPEESHPPRILKDLDAELAARPDPVHGIDPLIRLRTDADLAAWHVAQVEQPRPGDRPSDEALAGIAKADREHDPEALSHWLTRPQTMALLARPEFGDWLDHTGPRPHAEAQLG